MKKSYIVDSSYEDIRIDKWIRNFLGKAPQGLIEKLLRIGKIKLNNKKIKSSTKLHLKDVINVYNVKFEEKLTKSKFKFKPSNEIIKENEDLIIDDNQNFIVVNKESGIAVQGGTKSKKNLIDIFSKSKIFENSKPYSVHRLDKDTSGVFIMAKHRESAQLLTSLFRLRKVHKTYLAICHGELQKNSGEWNDDLTRYDNDREVVEKARTLYKVLDKNSICSLVEMKPITGRKHQLRKQLYNIGNPIVGDNKYFINRKVAKKKIKSKNLMLHAYKIKFIHPSTKKEMEIEAPLPLDFINTLKIL